MGTSTIWLPLHSGSSMSEGAINHHQKWVINLSNAIVVKWNNPVVSCQTRKGGKGKRHCFFTMFING